MNNMKRLKSSINDASQLLEESKSMEINKINIGILLASIEERKYRRTVDKL